MDREDCVFILFMAFAALYVAVHSIFERGE